MSAPAGQVRRSVAVVNHRGLHARAAARLAKVAGRFDADVTVGTGTQQVSALSIMGLLMLAAAKGTTLDIAAAGADAGAAAAALVRLVENGFEEEDFPGY